VTAWYRFNPDTGYWDFESYQHGHDYKQKPYGSYGESHFTEDITQVEYNSFAPIHGRMNGEQFLPEIDPDNDGMPCVYHSLSGKKSYMPLAGEHPGYLRFYRLYEENNTPTITEFNLGNAPITK